MQRDVALMVEAMRHASHYSTGIYSNAALGLEAGWAVHEGSFSDCMPLVRQQGEVVMIFLGEAFPTAAREQREIRADCLIDTYIERGKNFFRELNGWFSGVIADGRTGSVTVFNDKYGMSRLYFHETTDEFLFASEAKALLRVRPQLREISPQYLSEYLRYNCVTRGNTLFPGVTLLPYGSCVEFKKGALAARNRYFDFVEWERQTLLAPDDFYRRFEDVVSGIVPRYVQEPGRVGLSLTAGLDTRVIMAALAERGAGVPCYTFGGAWGELYDVRTARRLAGIAKQPFSVINAGDDFLRQFPEYARKAVYLSDGTHDAFGAHDVYFNASARGIAPIRLTGKFGSEVVRTRRVIPALTYPDAFLRGGCESHLQKLPTYAQLSTAAHPLTRILTEEIPSHEAGRVIVEQSQVVLRTPYMDDDLVRLMYQAPMGLRAAGNLQDTYVRQKGGELARVQTNLGRLSGNSELKRRLLYFILRGLFKVEYTYLFAAPHWATRLDRSLESLRLERIFAGRKKWEGYRIWIRTRFADFIRDTLLSRNAFFSRFFDMKMAERMISRHIGGTHNYLNEINRLLTVELIHLTLLRPEH
jgi:asparagine synthase (glutamine-hydrolysing)